MIPPAQVPMYGAADKLRTMVKQSSRWLLLCGVTGVLSGSASALFLWLLEVVASVHRSNSWLLALLPTAGLVIAAVYGAFGKSVEGGNNLIFQEIRDFQDGVPIRMGPLVLFGTLVTHLFGGSAGREGTAVQICGSMASGITRFCPRFGPREKSLLMTAGVAAGFAGVFGTPLAGVVFAIEVLRLKAIRYSAVFPCLIAATVSHLTCHAWGIQHTSYAVASQIASDSDPDTGAWPERIMMMTVVAGIAFGLASRLFSVLSHWSTDLFRRHIPNPLLRPIVGGMIVIGLFYLAGTRDYLGLGVHAASAQSVSILSAFHAGGSDHFSWLWKLCFTVVTLSSGFKGGEVTPLFFIGATLGNQLAPLLNVPIDLFAALGFVSVFAGATKTPLASIVMAGELFGTPYLRYFAASCLVADFFSGRTGIYAVRRSDVEPQSRLSKPTLARP